MGKDPGESAKSLTKTSKKQPRESKMLELLTQRTSWNTNFFEPC